MGRRQSWVRKMRNAANFGWIAAYSLQKEKAEKKEAGAGASQPALRRLGSRGIRELGGR